MENKQKKKTKCLGEYDVSLNNLREKVRVKMEQKVEPDLGIIKIILADAGYRGKKCIHAPSLWLLIFHLL